MTEQRLTAEAARPGMRVRCVEAHIPDLVAGRVYTVVERYGADYCRLFETGDDAWCLHRFTIVPEQPLAAILSARAPELLDAISVFHKAWGIGERHSVAFKSIRELLNAIERAGLLVPPEPPRPRTTEREATISEGWWT